MLHVVWPSDRATAGSTTPRPAKAPPKRSSDLKPFPGLTRTPPCAACEQAHADAPHPPGYPPPRIVPTRGRPRQVETSQHFCPHPDCAYQGWVGLGNLWVVYLYLAGNSVTCKTGIMPPFHHHGRGQRDG